jgi:hypothetical protein
VTSGNHGWPSTLPAKGLWILIASPLLCIAAGSVIGAAAFTIVNLGASGGSALDLLRAYAVSLLYSLLVTVPFGGVSGLVAALIIIALGKGSYRGASLQRWLRAGGAFGAAVGLACPMLLAVLGFEGDSRSVFEWFLFYGVTGSVAGAVVGMALGALGWREFGAATVNAATRIAS